MIDCDYAVTTFRLTIALRVITMVITMSNMKLRKIGNSLGTTFDKATLARAGFGEDDSLIVTSATGEIKIRRVGGRQVLDLSETEIRALASGDTTSKAGKALAAKARKLLALDN